MTSVFYEGCNRPEIFFENYEFRENKRSGLNLFVKPDRYPEKLILRFDGYFFTILQLPAGAPSIMSCTKYIPAD